MKRRGPGPRGLLEITHCRLLNHHPHFKSDGYDESGFCTADTRCLCNWQPWVITACTAGKLHKQEKTQQTIVKNIIPYHGVCWLSDKACADHLRAASTHCSYSTTDTLLLAGKTKSILKPCLARVCECMYVCVCKCFTPTLGCAKSTKTMLAFP